MFNLQCLFIAFLRVEYHSFLFQKKFNKYVFVMSSEEEALQGPVFHPPVYIQRYDAVKRLINELGSKRVLDIGCSEGKLLTNIRIHCSKVEIIIGIDIDKEVLQENRFRTKPLMAEYLKKRDIPLKMALFQGSVATPDTRFSNCDFISCIEVIEHLHKEELAAFPAAVFGVYRPDVVALSTPNADFNVLFPNMVGFRHPDHKFEWTRQEFKDWCSICSETYGYAVEFSFIGYGPEGTDNLGGCTQMAVFKKLPSIEIDGSLLENIQYGSYELVTETNFPYETPKTLGERLEDEIAYLINTYALRSFQRDDEQELLREELPLDYIVNAPRIKCICKDFKLIREAVVKHFELTEDESSIILPLNEDSDDDDDIDENSFDNDWNTADFIENQTTDCFSLEDGKEELWD